MLLQSLDQSVERRLCRVGNEARDRVVQVVFHGFEDLGHNGASKGFSFVVDVGVVAAREVNAFKAARLALSLRPNFLHACAAASFDEQGGAWWNLLHIFGGDVEGGLDDGTLRSRDHHIFVFVPKRRADAIGVAHHKGIAVTGHAAHHVATVKIDRGPAQHLTHVERVGDPL